MQTAVFQLARPHSQAGEPAVPSLDTDGMEKEDDATPAVHEQVEKPIPSQDDTWNEVTR